MGPSDFGADAPGRLVKTTGGHWAFVPDPLPPSMQLDVETIMQLEEATLALGELAGVGRLLPNAHLLIRPFIRKEAQASSRIEGTITRLDQLLIFEAIPSRGRADSAQREVLNYVLALEYGLKRLESLPVSLRLMRELHERLLAGVRGEQKNPGRFRRMQNAIGSAGSTRFVPPPVTEMTQALDDLERFIHQPTKLPLLVQIALIHYQFETIHPFMDGNGRIGRLLVPLLLYDRQVLPTPLLYLSAYFERHRDAYMEHLLNVSQWGNWLEWINFFLKGVMEQAGDSIRRAQRLLDLWQTYRDRLQAIGGSAHRLHLVDDLFSFPVTTIPEAQKLLGITYRAAQLNIEKLVAADILQSPDTEQSRPRLYYAPEIIRIIEADEAVAVR